VNAVAPAACGRLGGWGPESPYECEGLAIPDWAPLIYEAMTDDALLPIVARQAAAVLGLSTFVAGWTDRSGRSQVAASDGYGPDAAAAYDRFSHLDLWRRELGARPKGKGYASGELVREEDLVRSPFYNEYLARFLGRDVVHGWMALLGSKEESGHLGGVRPRASGELTEAEKAAADKLIPHFQRLVAVRRHMREGQAKPGSTEILDMLAAPVIATDPSGRILYMNERGEKMLERRACLTYARDGGLGAVQANDNDRLRAAIAAAGRDKATTVMLHRVAGGLPVAAVVAPSHAVSAQRHALIVISDPEARAAPERLKELFDLSRAEAEVAAALASGRSLDEIAEDRGVAVSTLRVQLKSIYAKTSTNRQAELVSLIVGLHRFDLG
jgi:DNA-binding CsgD family transcriptional regulator/PAS domain-containing protein